MVYAERTTWTAAELAALSDGDHYELVKGRLIHMAPASADHGETSLGLGAALRSYADSIFSKSRGQEDRVVAEE